MDRKPLPFVPTWEGDVQAWALLYIKRNQWRFRPVFDYDDLVQEAWLKFRDCAYHYPRVNNLSHFMSLYQTALRNRFHALASQACATSRVQTPQSAEDDGRSEDEKLDRFLQPDGHPGHVKLVLREAPPEIKKLVHACKNTSCQLNGKAKRKGVTAIQPRKTTNEELCEIAGLDPNEVNLADMVRVWLEE